MVKFIEPAGGLANRLRVVLTALEKHGPDTVFIWKNNRDCACDWEDLFEYPVIRTIPAAIPDSIYTRTCTALIPIEPRLYRPIVPVKAIREAVDRFVRGNAPFDAIHVRRTDHTGLAKKAGQYTSDEDFFRFVDGKGRFFLACDEPATVAKFKERYGAKCLSREIAWQDGHRKTTVQDALIDLLICKKGVRFMGSGYSSFSDTINLMRGKSF